MTVRRLAIAAHAARVLDRQLRLAGEQREACGLLGGYFRGIDSAVITVVYPLSNLSLRKHSFAVDVEEFCRVRDAIEDVGLVPLALYHSHLDGSTRSSFRDRKLPWITDLLLLILAWKEGKLHFECYGDVDGKTVPISVFPYYDSGATC